MAMLVAPSHSLSSRTASARYLDHKSARCLKIKSPGSVHPARRRHIKAIIFQALIERVHLRLAGLRKADVKAGWVADLGRLARMHQHKREAVVVEQPGHVGVPSAHV